jgi:hypothetical protein
MSRRVAGLVSSKRRKNPNPVAQHCNSQGSQQFISYTQISYTLNWSGVTHWRSSFLYLKFGHKTIWYAVSYWTGHLVLKHPQYFLIKNGSFHTSIKDQKNYSLDFILVGLFECLHFRQKSLKPNNFLTDCGRIFLNVKNNLFINGYIYLAVYQMPALLFMPIFWLREEWCSLCI